FYFIIIFLFFSYFVSGVCGKPELADNTVPVSDLSHNIGASIRIQCAKGYVRKAGTSSLIRCTQQQNHNASWHSELPLKCIRKSCLLQRYLTPGHGMSAPCFLP
uniref:Sushi domain-containing protein n=1 Tax=Sinocyclocheilus grahami TaxID=75366 RepID=A0A672T6T6_SINGR